MTRIEAVQALAYQYFAERRAIAPKAGLSYGSAGDEMHRHVFYNLVTNTDPTLGVHIVDALESLVASGFLAREGSGYVLTVKGAKEI